MEIKIETVVDGNAAQVFEQFELDLFTALLPPLGIIKLMRFDGSKEGDEVHLSFPLGQQWISVITESVSEMGRYWFIDEGKQLPWPLRDWKHRHIVTSEEQGKSRIIDHISFSTGIKVLDFLFYPLLYLSFLMRKPAYLKYFAKKN